MDATEYQEWEKTMLSDIGSDTDALIKMLGSEKVTEGYDSGVLAGMLQNKGIDPGILAMMQNNGGLGGQNGGIWLLLLFLLILGGGTGFGNRGTDVAKESTLINQGNYEALMNAITTQGTRQEVAIGDLANSVGASISDVKMALASMDKQIAVSEGDIKSAIQSCCCNVRQAITNQGYENQLAVQKLGTDLGAQISAQTNGMNLSFSAQNQMIQSQFASQNAYLAEQFCAIKNREDQREIQALRDKLAEQRDTANTNAILLAIANKDTVSVNGTMSATAGTWTGTGSLS